MGIVLLVCFVVIMLLWLLSMLGAIPNAPLYSPWLAWFAILFLALYVFLGGGRNSISRVGNQQPRLEFVDQNTLAL